MVMAKSKAEKRKDLYTGSLQNLDIPECGFYNLREKWPMNKSTMHAPFYVTL